LPYDLLAEALDTEQPVAAGRWQAIPLQDQATARRVLVIHASQSEPGKSSGDLAAPVGHWWSALLQGLSARRWDKLRIDQLEAILDIAAQWGQMLEMDQLLEQIAETSTRLLNAERASIFLWDRTQKTLVGRPALGVEGGELRIADDTGVVGAVVHSGQAQRVDADIDRSPIDHSVDRQLGFETRTLLCVPLRGRGGDLFGAFELVNKRNGNFTAEDELALKSAADAGTPVLAVVNKVDQVRDKGALLPYLEALSRRHAFVDIVPVSAKSGDQLDVLERVILAHLPEAPKVFPPDQLTDRSERFFAGELLREQLTRRYGEELPYQTTVEIEGFEEQGGRYLIHALIWVERPGQKAIVIGHRGEALKAAATRARQEMQRLFDRPVHLEVWVKVKDSWSSDEAALASLGYSDR